MCSRPHETFSCATVLTAQVLSGLPAIWKSYGQSPQETRLPARSRRSELPPRLESRIIRPHEQFAHSTHAMHGSMRRQPANDSGYCLRGPGRLGLQQATWTGAARWRRLLRLKLCGRSDQPHIAGRCLWAWNLGCRHCGRSPLANEAICQSLGPSRVRALVEPTILGSIDERSVRVGDRQHILRSYPKADTLQRRTPTPDSLSGFPKRMEPARA